MLDAATVIPTTSERARDAFALAIVPPIAEKPRMTAQGPSPEDLARVAQAALRHVADGMTLGLGTGRAAEAFIHALGERVRGGLRVRGVPTSLRSDELARKLNIEVLSLEEAGRLDGLSYFGVYRHLLLLQRMCRPSPPISRPSLV